MKSKVLFIAIIAVLIIGGIGAWFYFSNNGEILEESELNPEDPLAVVARVNNEDINQGDLENFEMQILLEQGVESVDDLDETERENLRSQALSMLISNVLIWQATADSGITATEEEIDAQLERVRSQFEDEAQYQEALSQEGMSETDLKSQLATEIATQKYIEANLDIDSLTATEEEISAFYEQEAASAENVPPLSEIKEQIKSFVIQQKQSQMYNEYIQELREEADIEILI